MAADGLTACALFGSLLVEGEHKEVWGDESQSLVVSYRDDSIAQNSRAGGQFRIVRSDERRHRTGQSMAARCQPDGVAACTGTRKLYAPRIARRDPDRDGLRSHSPLSVFTARSPLWILGAVGVFV